MLNVHGGDDMDSGGENILNILVSLCIPAAGHICMGEFVNDDDLRTTAQDRIDIHFFNDDAVIFDLASWNEFSAFDQFGCFNAAVRLDESDDNIYSFFFEAVRFLKHLITFPHARPVAEIDLQPAALGSADHLQESLCSIFSHIPLINRARS